MPESLEERAMESNRRTARLAGLTYLLLGISSVLGLLDAPLLQGNATPVLKIIAASELRFRVGIVSDLISQVSGIFLVLLLYQLLKPVNKRHATLMVILMLVSIPISLVIALDDVAAKILLSGAESLSAFTKPQLDVLAMVFLRLHVTGVFVVEVFWGLWLFPFGLLVFRSRFLPRILGVFLIVGSLANVAHCFVSLLLPGPLPGAYQLATMIGRAIGELPIMFWLLIKGSGSNDLLHEPPGPKT
jgi:hypothetical protein